MRLDNTPSWKLFVNHDQKMFESLSENDKNEFLNSLKLIIKFYEDVSINTREVNDHEV